MDGLWGALARALSRDPGWQGARDGKRGYPGDGHGVAVATYGRRAPERQTPATVQPAVAKEAGHG